MVASLATSVADRRSLGNLVTLVAFSNLRKLTLDQVRNGWNGLFHLLRNLGLARLSGPGDRFVEWVVRDWWLSIPFTILVLLWFGIWLAQGLSTPALPAYAERSGTPSSKKPDRAAGRRPLREPCPSSCATFASATPAQSRRPRRRHARRAARRLVAIVSLTAPESRRCPRPRRPAPRRSGEARRPGGVGLGHAGGTAIVSQRPEAQVLGVRVRDDVVWGLPEPEKIDVDRRVARSVAAASSTARPRRCRAASSPARAIAAALAVGPSFDLQARSAAMVVRRLGRALLVTLFRDLAHDDGLGVVHVTHRAAEAAVADRSITLERGRVVDAPVLRPTADQAVEPRTRCGSKPLITLGTSVTSTPAAPRGPTVRSPTST